MKRVPVLAALVVILLLAAGLRFYQLDGQSFWNDEGNSARLSERSIPLIVEGTASDIHPPLYYLLLRGWRELLGESEYGLRAMSAFAGLALVAVTFALGQQLFGRQAAEPALLAALFAAINPALVYYSQEARMYELLALLAILSTLLLVRWLRGRLRSPSLGLVYALTSAAGLYTHYFYPAVLLAQNVVFLAWLPRRQRERPGAAETEISSRSLLQLLVRWLVAMAVTFLLYLPWLPIFLRQAGGREGLRASLSLFVLDSLRWMGFGESVEPAAIRWATAALAVLFILGLYAGRRLRVGGVPFTATVLAGAAVPPAFMWLAGSTATQFHKFLLVAVPFVCLGSALGLWWLWRQPAAGYIGLLARVMAAALVVLVVSGSTRSLQNMVFEPAYARADYRGIAAQIAAENHPEAAVVLDAPNQWEVFTYYHRDGAPVYPIPRGRPDPAAIGEELSAIAAEHQRIYALFWGEAQRDPQRLVERWLDDHTFKARDEWVGDVRFVTYAVPPEPAEEMANPLELPFGEAITLAGYTLLEDSVRPGDILQLTLFWRAEEPIAQRYKIFLHLVGNDGPIVAQRDSEPGGGLALTTTWVPGETVVDNHGFLIPEGTPPGEYRLLLGLYDFADPAARQPIAAAGGVVDAYELATITVSD